MAAILVACLAGTVLPAACADDAGGRAAMPADALAPPADVKDAPADTQAPPADAPASTADAGAGVPDTAYVPPQGEHAELCAILPFDFGAPPSQTACPATPPEPPAPCLPGTTCQYVWAADQHVEQTIAYCGPASTYVLRSSRCRGSCPPPDQSISVRIEGAACNTREVHHCPPGAPGMTRFDRLEAALGALADSCGLPAPGSGASVQVWFDGDCVSHLIVRHHRPVAHILDCLAQKLRSVRLSCVAGFACGGVSRALD